MYSLVKSWDNRKETKANRLPTTNKRTWTKRMQWLESADTNVVKLKFDDGETYFETGVQSSMAQTVWDRFKDGQSIEDAVSILGVKVQLSRRAAKGS